LANNSCRIRKFRDHRQWIAALGQPRSQ